LNFGLVDIGQGSGSSMVGSHKNGDMTMPNRIDHPIVSELARQDPEFADIVIEFVATLATRLESMEQAIIAQDFDALRTAAHQLKGSAGGYGYPSLTDVAGVLEGEAKTQQLKECDKTLAELKEMISRVVV